MLIGQTTDLDTLQNMEVVRPERAGSKWVGIRHHDVVTGIRQQLDYQGIEVTDLKVSVSGDNNESLVGLYYLNPANPIDGQRYILGFRHSNDLRNPLTLSIGTSVIVCHNGVITGEHVMRRKHTKGLDLERELFEGIREVASRYERVSYVINAMRSESLVDPEYFMVEGARKKMYPWSWIGKVDKEYSNPSEDNPEVEMYSRTPWALYNAVNYVARDMPAERQFRCLHQFSKLMGMSA